MQSSSSSSSIPKVPSLTNLADGFKTLFVTKPPKNRGRSFSNAADSPREVVKISRTHMSKCSSIPQFLEQVVAENFNLKEHSGTSLSCHSFNNYGVNVRKEPELNEQGRPIRCIIPVYPDDPKEPMKEDAIEIATHEAYYDKIMKQIFSHESFSHNADVAHASVIKKFACIIIADGCGNRKSAQRAAQLSVDTSIQVLKERLRRVAHNTQDIARAIFECVVSAQNMLHQTNDRIEEELKKTELQADRDLLNQKRVSSTTLSIGVIAGDKLVVLSVGDSKFFLIRRIDEELACVDITKHSRRVCKDATDPGGRLDGENEIDLRNLSVAVVPLLKDDIVVGCTDGVHDNIQKSSEDASEEDQYKTFAQNFVDVAGGVAPHIIPNLMRHIEKLCLPSKRFLLENATGRLPENTDNKPDHATIAVAKFEQSALKKPRGSHTGSSSSK